MEPSTRMWIPAGKKDKLVRGRCAKTSPYVHGPESVDAPMGGGRKPEKKEKALAVLRIRTEAPNACSLKRSSLSRNGVCVCQDYELSFLSC
jgi:hypothetical protein